MMNISNIITTNIDNLIPSIIDKSQRYYLSNVTYYGPTKRMDNQSIIFHFMGMFYSQKVIWCSENLNYLQLMTKTKGCFQ